MDPKLLQHLSAVVSYGSLSRAAEQLGVTQPTLTRSMKAIEDRTGAPVLTRTRHGMQPTELGLRLASIGDRIADEGARADDLIRQTRRGIRDEVRIGVGPLIEYATMKDFVADYPRSRDHILHFKVGSASLLFPDLRRGIIDLLLAPVALEMESSGLVSEMVFPDQLSVMVGRKSRFFGVGRKVSLAELESERWIQSGASAGIANELEVDEGAIPRLVFTGAIGFVAHLLATSDVAVWMPRRLMHISGAIALGQSLSVDGPERRRDVAIWTSETAMSRPAVRKARDAIRDYFIELDRSTPN